MYGANLHLNLLAPAKKDRTEYLVRMIFIKEMLEIVIFTCALLAMALLWGWLVLQEDFSNLAQSALSINREHQQYNQQVRGVNRVIKNLNLAGQGFYPLTPKIAKLSQTIPADVRLNSFTINREINQLIMSGTAQTRTALLNFQSALRQLDWLKNISAPSSQLLQKENVDFEISATLSDAPAFRFSSTADKKIRRANTED